MKRMAFAVVAFCVLLYPRCVRAQEDVTQKVFERIFGDAVKLDPAMIAKVLAGKPGERHYVDTNHDGKPDEVWFIDTAKRHPQAMQPVLVRAIDENGDLVEGAEPDLVDDLYVVDWKADGKVDAVCDYTDTDGDGGADEMALYSRAEDWQPVKDKVVVWWGRNIGKDHLLWFDVGYTYRQHDCQYRSHFGGDEMFCAFALGLEEREWIPLWENPFLFYDRDKDGVTEEVVRIGGRGTTIENLRYGFDADNDATLENPRDFDVSITCHAVKGMTLDACHSEHTVLRGIPTGAFLSYYAARDFCHEQRWADMLLCWDEDDLNIDGDSLKDGRFVDTQERWEGVICKGNEFFAQVGGPSCGLRNKRFEVATAPSTPMRTYFAPTDQRLHLFGANHQWLIVDFDYDGKPDMRYEYLDTDGNGYIDTYMLDINNDGQPEDSWSAGDAPMVDVPYTWSEVNAVIAPVIASAPEQLLGLDARLEQAAAKLGAGGPDPLRRFIDTGLDTPYLSDDLRVRLLSSNESWRYFLDLLKDRLIIALKSKHADPEFWKGFNALRAKGDWTAMRERLETAFQLAGPLPVFADTRAALLAKYAKPRVAWGQDWVPPNIGWESDVCAYRAYWGQFDFFGKKKPCLVLPAFAPGSASYHEEQDWGMDTLHVGNTCGLGGVTLYVDGQAIPVWSPEGKGNNIAWSKRLVSESPDKVAIEMRAGNVGPEAHPYTVRYVCTALAGRRDSPIEVTVEGGPPGAALELGIGITKLTHETFALDTRAGILASWGYQEPAIGTIGLGVVFPASRFLRVADLPDQHQVVLKIEKGAPIVYHIQGDWLNGRRFPRCPNADDWVQDLKRTAVIAALK